MDWPGLKKKVVAMIKEYRYAAIILAAGLILMLLPSGRNNEEKDIVPLISQPDVNDLEDRLGEILSSVQGAGKVKILLTQARGEQTVYQTDIQERVDSLNEDTVIVTGSDRNQQGLICQKISPKYLGAVIVCQGADKAVVRLALVEAVSNATGLSTDAITVLKMK